MFPFTDDIVNEWFERTFDEDVGKWLSRDKRDKLLQY